MIKDFIEKALKNRVTTLVAAAVAVLLDFGLGLTFVKKLIPTLQIHKFVSLQNSLGKRQ